MNYPALTGGDSDFQAFSKVNQKYLSPCQAKIKMPGRWVRAYLPVRNNNMETGAYKAEVNKSDPFIFYI